MATIKVFSILIIAFLFSLNINGQGKKIILIIDTLFIQNGNDFHVGISNKNNLISGLGEYIEDSLYNRQHNKYPNFYCSIVLNSDSSNIQLSLDNENGYINLINVYSSKYDTIRLSKHIVYDNCYNDTAYTTMTYYHKKINEPLGTPYKIKHNKTITKASCKNKPPLSTKYIINHKKYDVIILKEIDGGVYISDFHGYRPNEYNLKPETYKGKVSYFHGRTESRSYVNVINLKIKNGL